MNKANLVLVALSFTLTSTISAGVFKIGGFTFDEKNTVTTAIIVEGSQELKDHTSSRFGRFSEEYVTDPTSRTNEFERFNRAKSLGRLLGRSGSGKSKDHARYISFPDIKESPPTPNVDRCSIELTWGAGMGLPNGPGKDFVVFEHANFQGFEVAVQKTGAASPSAYRYQFANSKDSLHEANAVAFDLSDFGLTEGEMITAIRIRNIFNSKAEQGADKVDQESGQGNVVYPKDPGYEKAFTLREKSGGDEYSESSLSADVLYVAALRNVEAVKLPEPPPTPAVEPVV
ncbi:MAG: Autotransporter-associated beta strand repeat protein, partial [Verrucomicrobiales bacterium]|nr:Autotransporter-associated beta strand repeat protein [Verrucomicrobiales bacterium]